MSKFQVEVLFNKDGRDYLRNEQITGRVLIEALEAASCQKIWIDYGWRTHGKGNQDHGPLQHLALLSENTQFQKGERREYSFAIPALQEPITYHGVNLNIDWYVTAHVAIPLGRDISTEEDFLVLANTSPWGATAGISFTRGDEAGSQFGLEPEDSAYQQSDGDPFNSKPKSNYRYPLFLLVLLIAVVLLRQDNSAIYTTIFFVLLFLIVIRKFLFNLIASRKLKVLEAIIDPATIHNGDQVYCRIRLQAKGSIYLENIASRLTAQETCTRGSGTNVTTFKAIITQRTVVKPYNEQLSAGREIFFRGDFTLSSDAPPSFNAPNNSIKWFIDVKISPKRWPAWEKTLPVTVLPR